MRNHGDRANATTRARREPDRLALTDLRTRSTLRADGRLRAPALAATPIVR
ncbi:hypothetical protein [Streptomyces sp. NPDC057939]|uniref:hypothetical protein n=1 Tax=Streptomyces sp. NPDC057939 TaxID=3346284 RepID=UPI0036E3FDC9